MASTDEFGKHEVIHTSSIIMEMFEEYICDHDSVKGNAEVDEAADKVFSALFNFYQLVGGKWLGGDSEIDSDPPYDPTFEEPPIIGEDNE